MKKNDLEWQKKAVGIRTDILQMVYNAKSGHLGGSLSIVEILIALYDEIMNIDPQNPKWEDRDRFVLSKGHTAPALYAVLASRGYFDKELLYQSYRRINSTLQGHPDMKKTPGIDMSSGSLGIGLSAACGMALSAKKQKKGFRVYTILGDGEANEGGIWEAALFGAHYGLDNLTAFLDLNGMQNDGFTGDVMKMDDMRGKWDAFGWHTQEIDGHDIKAILTAVEKAKQVQGKPSMILCHTVKGKGVSFMEHAIKFHGGCPTQEEYELAMKELAGEPVL